MAEKAAKVVFVDAVSKVAAEKVEKVEAATLLMNGKKKILMTPTTKVAKVADAALAEEKAKARAKVGVPSKDQKVKAKAKEKDSEGKEKDKARIPLSLPLQQ